MKYKIKNEEVTLPLTVEAIQNWIKDSGIHAESLRFLLYRDILICLKTGAAHGKELAEAALVLEPSVDELKF